jgi:nicotinate-nucleotide adenylyltransferase
VRHERPVTRIGILGGTFNPPHLGHLAVAAHAYAELGLKRVLLMPACVPPHKRGTEDPGPEHRLGMCRLLVKDAPGLSVCALEIEREGPSYTVDTLRAIHASHPDAQLTFILGADTASTLPSWREPVELLGLADLAVAAREGSGREGVRDILAPLLAARPPGGGRRSATEVRFLSMPVTEVSSSAARERVGRGEPIEDLVGTGVAGYIAEHGLYRSPSRAQS